MRVSAAVLALLLTLPAGCALRPPEGAAPRAEPPEAEPPWTTQEFLLRNGFVEVSVTIPPSPPGPKPAIISPIGDDREHLERGYVLVRYRANWNLLTGALPRVEPEPPSQTEDTHVGTWLLAAPRPGIVGRGYFGLIGVDARLATDVVDLLETLPEVDPRRIAIAGSSTSGFTALEALGAEPRLAAAVVRVACGDYHLFLRDSSLALAGEERWLENGKIVLDADYDADLMAREPIRHAERLPPRPLLMLNGALDTAIPLSCALRTAEQFERAYANAGVAERFRFVLFDRNGHSLGQDANREVLAFWRRWL